MESEKITFISLLGQCVYPRVLPNVGTVALVLAKHHVVPVASFPIAEHKNQLVAGAIEGTHAAVVLDPDTEIEKAVIDLMPCRTQFRNVSPVHADEMNRGRRAIWRDRR